MGRLIAPLRPHIPALKPGQNYLLEVVLRTMKLGHPFTPGHGRFERGLGGCEGDQRRTGGWTQRRPGQHKEVDPWAHFVNVFMLDRDGNRIDRRNPQDIFTPLYNHQIPPGAAQVVHYEFTVPEDRTSTADGAR